MGVKRVAPILAITMALALGLAAQVDGVAHADTKSGYIACAAVRRQAVTVGGATGGTLYLEAGPHWVSYAIRPGTYFMSTLMSGRGDAEWLVQASNTASPAKGECRI